MPAKKGTRRGAHGAGSIRHLDSGRWEGRYTLGRDPGTGKQIQKSVYGVTESEVVNKLAAIKTEINNGTYTEPSKLTVAQWLDIWTSTYLCDVKPRTSDSYESICRLYLKPALGAVKFQKLSSPAIQKLYTNLQREKKLSPKTIKCVHGVLHKTLQKALELGYIRQNPSKACVLPRLEKREVTMLQDDAITAFMNAVKGHKYETLYYVDLFTGMRQGEILGLTWDCVDFESGMLIINKQLQRKRNTGGEYSLVPTKSDRTRKITPAPTVMERLREHRGKQAEMQLFMGSEWSNPFNLVFTNEYGRNYAPTTVYKHLKRMVASIGAPEARFHDLRHSYAVAAIHAGDDIKTVQENLGHHTAAFTLDVYGHVTERMKKDSAARMDEYIKTTLNCG